MNATGAWAAGWRWTSACGSFVNVAPAVTSISPASQAMRSSDRHRKMARPTAHQTAAQTRCTASADAAYSPVEMPRACNAPASSGVSCACAQGAAAQTVRSCAKTVGRLAMNTPTASRAVATHTSRARRGACPRSAATPRAVAPPRARAIACCRPMCCFLAQPRRSLVGPTWGWAPSYTITSALSPAAPITACPARPDARPRWRTTARAPPRPPQRPAATAGVAVAALRRPARVRSVRRRSWPLVARRDAAVVHMPFLRVLGR